MTPEEQRVTQLCDDLLAQHDPKSTPPAEFLGAQYDRGIAWVHFPEGSGGLGLSPKLQNTINGKLFGAGAPIPYARNSRKIPARAIDKVAASINEFGFRVPIVVDRSDSRR